MDSKIDKGQKGENLAAEYLIKKGYELVHKNWRSSRSEVDLIMRRGSLLVFVEVKYRMTLTFGHPEESVSKGKIIKLGEAMVAFQEAHPEYDDIRLDVLSIYVDKKNNAIEYFHIEDVYF